MSKKIIVREATGGVWQCTVFASNDWYSGGFKPTRAEAIADCLKQAIYSLHISLREIGSFDVLIYLKSGEVVNK
jgi:hypothetical protein